MSAASWPDNSRIGVWLRALIVDDMRDAREMYASYFQFRGASVAQASNGLEAVQEARYKTPDVILLDLAMPRVTGWEAIRLLKMDPRTRRIPIAVVSGQLSRAAKAEAMEAGADLYLTKPILPEDVFREVVDLLRRCVASQP
jgi:twitching motility two-component system response regulator PilH